MTNVGHPSPVEVVQGFWGLVADGDIDAAKAVWADGAIWHLTGSSRRARDYGIDAYLAMIVEWFATFPSYSAEILEWRTIGDLAYFTARSKGGEAPGSAEGLTVYRVSGGRIAEGWGIPSDAAFGF